MISENLVECLKGIGGDTGTRAYKVCAGEKVLYVPAKSPTRAVESVFQSEGGTVSVVTDREQLIAMREALSDEAK